MRAEETKTNKQFSFGNTLMTYELSVFVVGGFLGVFLEGVFLPFRCIYA